MLSLTMLNDVLNFRCIGADSQNTSNLKLSNYVHAVFFASSHVSNVNIDEDASFQPYFMLYSYWTV